MYDTEMQTAIIAVKESGKIIKENFRAKKNVEWKDETGRNPVTDIDKECEKKIVSILLEKFPDYNILAEEGSTNDKNSEFTWVIDPIDGTRNFLEEIPFVSCGLSLKKEDDIVLAVCYDPLHDELFKAEKGKGAFLNDKKIQVSNRDLRISSLVHSRKAASIVGSIYGKVPIINNLGCAHLHLCYVACGRYDIFMAEEIGPWDYAPYLIVEEAGGKVTDIDGNKMNIFGKSILASNGKVHDEILRIISK